MNTAASWVHRSIRTLSCGILFFTAAPVWSQSAFNWRVFTTADGLPSSSVNSVTLGPRGNAWLKHDEASIVTRFDGYHFDSFPFPGTSPSRIYEGRSTQLWAVDQEGILESSDGRWLRFPLAAIRQEYEQNVRRVTQPIDLIPLRINNVLALLSDQLIHFDSRANETTLIKHANTLNIGLFKNLIERANQTILVTGQTGIAIINTSPRLLSANTEWIEHLPPSDLGLHDFHRPTENADGSVSMVALGRDKQRFIATFDGTGWRTTPVGTLRLRHAWQRYENEFWGISYNGAYQILDGTVNPVGDEEVAAGLLLDVTVESPNEFMVATSEGLYRYAPACWRRPRGISDIDSPIHDVSLDSAGNLWFLNSEALLKFDGANWQRLPWPDDGEILFRPSDSIHQLNDRTLLVQIEDVFYQVDTIDQRISPLPLLTDGKIQKIVGQTQQKQPIILWQPNLEDPLTRHLAILNSQGVAPYAPFPDPWPRATELELLVELENQELWFGDQEGVGMIGPDGLISFGPEHGVPADRATGIIETDNGMVWASIGSGIYEYDGRRWRTLFAAPDQVNSMIIGSDESVWATSNKGIHRYHFESWLTLTSQEGLKGNAVYSIIEDARGQIWAGSTRGVNRYHPDADLDPPRSSIRILASSPDPEGNNSKLAVFEARDKWDFTRQDRLLFSYRLDERPWTPYSERNDLILEDLSAGQHRLEVRAMDRNWNEEEIAADYQFMWIIPWYDDPRLLVITAVGFSVILLLAGLAINRHLRLIRSYAEVERIVAVRTAELESANRELLQTQKMRALGTLSAGIAHDFNGILSIIKGSTQIIETNLDNEAKVRTRLERIRLVVDQGAGVIRAMLGLARSGEKHLKEIDINETTDKTIQVMDDRLPENIVVELDCPTQLAPVKLVVDLLQQTLINLISNASDAMEGSGTIQVRTGFTSSTPPGIALAPAPASGFNFIAIQDTGYGIAPEMLPRIFEPFFTSKSFSSKRGTGLGLSMVYEMAREMKAGLAVESSLGKGSTFTIYIPTEPLNTPSSSAPGNE